MPHEIIGELIVGAIEVGAEVATNSDSKKPGIGCLAIIVLAIFGCVLFYYNY